MPNFTFYGGRKQAKLEWDSQEINSGKFAYIWHFSVDWNQPRSQALPRSVETGRRAPWELGWIGINATKFKKPQIHFKSDVFATVAVVDAKDPY